MVWCLVAVSVGGLALAICSPYARRHAESVNCGNQMASIGLAAKSWALDNEGRLPSDFRSMSNELAATRLLVCSGDHLRVSAKDWAFFDRTNSSYEIISPGMSLGDTTNVYFR